jgi:hypothetical protein
MLGIADAVEKTIGGAQNREGNFRAIDQRSETLAMALAGFAEENRVDAAAGAQSFFDEADAFYSDGAGFGGQPTAQGKAKFLEPAILATGNRGGRWARCAGVAGEFAKSGHECERSKFPEESG